MSRECPECKKQTLGITNVIGTTKEIHWHCRNCHYREKTGYNYVTH